MRSDLSYESFMGQPQLYETDAYISDYVIGDDGSIYIQPISTYQTGGYIKLDKQADGTYVAHTPQVFYDQDNHDGTHILAWATRMVLKTTPDGAVYYDAEEDGNGGYNTDMKFTFEDGVLQQADMTVNEYGLPNEILAMTDPNGDWAIWGSGHIKISPLPEGDELTVLPEDAEQFSTILSFNTVDPSTGNLASTQKGFTCATSPSEPGVIYINNPYERLSNQWIKGQINDDNSWTFKRQYIGTYDLAQVHTWFFPATFTVESQTENNMTYYGAVYTFADEITLKYDETTQTRASAANEAMLINVSPNTPWYAEAYNAPAIKEFADVPAIPADPTILSLSGNYGSGGYFSFSLPAEDVDGNFIDSNKMFYRVFTNGNTTEPFVFTPEEYQKLTEEMTDVPYGFTDMWDFSASSTSTTHGFYFYRTDLTRLGVQSVYVGGGEERVSNIVWGDVPGTGINSVTAEEEGEVTYYDLQGRRVNNPTKGIFIKKTTTSNGTKAVKIMK